jgi:hypothetical protein
MGVSIAKFSEAFGWDVLDAKERYLASSDYGNNRNKNLELERKTRLCAVHTEDG